MANHKVYKIGGDIFIEVAGETKKHYQKDIDFDIANGKIFIQSYSSINPGKYNMLLSELQNKQGVAVGSLSDVEVYLSELRAIYNPENRAPFIIAKMNKVENETTLSAAGTIDDTSITVTSATGFAVGKYVTMYSVSANRFYVGYVLGVAGSIISLDTPLDFAYQIGDFVTSGITNMAVNGETDTLGELGEFGDITALIKGVVFRKKDGVHRNIFNVKTNAEMKALMYDFELISSGGPQSPDGFSGRFTLSKLGAVLEIKPGEDVQLIIQDDLSALSKFEIIVEGHIRDY